MRKKLAGVNESNFKYWKIDQIVPYLLIDAVLAFSSGKMDTAFRKVRLALAELKYGYSIELKREYIDSIEKDINVNTRIFGFLKKVPPFSLSFKEWSEQTCKLLQIYWQLESEPVFVPFKKKKYGDLTMKEFANMPIQSYYQSCDASSEGLNCINTIHSVKGETLDAVLLFLSQDSRGECISLNDFPRTVIRTMTEKQRLIYVACSRATQFLALAVPAQITDSDVKNALGGIEVDFRAFNLEEALAFE